VPYYSTDCDDEDSKVAALEPVYEIVGIRSLKPKLEFLGDVARHEEASRCGEASRPNPGRVVQLCSGDCHGKPNRQIRITIQHRIQPGSLWSFKQLDPRDLTVAAIDDGGDLNEDPPSDPKPRVRSGQTDSAKQPNEEGYECDVIRRQRRF